MAPALWGSTQTDIDLVSLLRKPCGTPLCSSDTIRIHVCVFGMHLSICEHRKPPWFSVSVCACVAVTECLHVFPSMYMSVVFTFFLQLLHCTALKQSIGDRLFFPSVSFFFFTGANQTNDTTFTKAAGNTKQLPLPKR